MEGDKDLNMMIHNDIPIGHKVALKDFEVGEDVIKYGIVIGKVVAPIKKGEHVHVHNLKTKRW
jgi:(2R)-sulfolactate sulfo-lyase subunit alpha